MFLPARESSNALQKHDHRQAIDKIGKIIYKTISIYHCGRHYDFDAPACGAGKGYAMTKNTVTALLVCVAFLASCASSDEVTSGLDTVDADTATTSEAGSNDGSSDGDASDATATDSADAAPTPIVCTPQQ